MMEWDFKITVPLCLKLRETTQLSIFAEGKENFYFYFILFFWSLLVGWGWAKAIGRKNVMYVSSMYYFVLFCKKSWTIFDNKSKWWKMLLSCLVFICFPSFGILFLILLSVSSVSWNMYLPKVCNSFVLNPDALLYKLVNLFFIH